MLRWLISSPQRVTLAVVVAVIFCVLVVLGAFETTQPATVLAFAGAVVVAITTGVTTGYFQDLRLQHERALKDLDHLRALFDDCAEAVQLVAFGLHTVNATMRSDREGADRVTVLTSSLLEYRSAITALSGTLGRLRLLFPRSRPVCKAYEDVWTAGIARYEHLRDAGGDEMLSALTDEADAEDSRLAQEFQHKFMVFATAAQTEVGSATTLNTAR